jgi:hypothetical protein
MRLMLKAFGGHGSLGPVSLSRAELYAITTILRKLALLMLYESYHVFIKEASNEACSGLDQ